MWGGPWTEADTRVGLCFGAKHHEWSDRSSRVLSEPGSTQEGASAPTASHVANS